VQTPAQTPVDLLIEAAWVLPVEPHGTVLEDHAVVVDGASIVDLLPAAAARLRYAPRESVQLREHALLPGLVNAHTHNPMTLMRGLADDLPLMEWLRGHIWPAEARAMGPEFVRDGIELAVAEMLRGGTTTCSENYFFPDIIGATYRRLGFRALVGLPVIEFPSAWASSRDEYFDKATAVHDDFRRDPLISTCFAPHAPYTVSDASFTRIGVLSDQLDVPVHLHLHETAQEVADSRQEFGVRPLQRIQGLGLLNRSLIAVHMTQLEDSEIEACARAGVGVVHCPESNLKLASGFCPVARLLAAGVTVGLGTDGCASNNDLDMFGEMRTAALLAKGVAADPRALDAAATLHMATLGSARAIGLGDSIGSIVPGKQADLVAVRLDDLESTPFYHLASQLVYAGNRRQVSDVWIAGRRKLSAGVLHEMDPAELRARAQRWQRFLAGNA
jgi:5-methylthioadenosine/S-adenosylhomocysteine deaminase